jgi:multidrug efflux pump subunit AcrA (membrane-fusion protein)
MQGDSPYRIEMYVSEVDVPKLSESMTGSIVLDAFRNETLPLRVAEIDDRATDKDGVPKYRVKLDFLSPHTGLRIGMTGDAAIVTGSRKGVLSVPRRSVLEGTEGQTVVRVLEGKLLVEKTVTTGMEGDSDVEVLTGLKEGETVIVLVKQ